MHSHIPARNAREPFSVVLLILLLVHFPVLLRAEILEIDLSPPGSGEVPGLSPANEIIPGLSTGSGGENGTGIFFDSITRLLTLNLAYGSAFGFSDLTSPAFAWLLHGPSPIDETAPVLFNLQPLHAFAADHSRGGIITGDIVLTSEQAMTLLSGLSYINIYTPANLGGEIRGQLVIVPEPQVWAILLGGVASLGVVGRLRRRFASAR